MPRIQDVGEFVRSRPREPFGTDTLVFENCSTVVVSADRAIDRTPHDPGNVGALCLTKEMH